LFEVIKEAWSPPKSYPIC